MARSFNGSSDKLQVLTTPLTGAPFTFWAWINLDGNPTGDATVISIADSASDQYHQMVVRSGGEIRVRTRATAGVTAATTIGTISANTWHTCAFTSTGVANRSAWLDATESTANTTSRNPGSIDRIGVGVTFRSGSGDDIEWFEDTIAHAAMWSNKLSQEDMNALQDGASPLRVRRDILVAYWPLLYSGSSEPNLADGAHSLAVTGAAVADGPPVQPMFFKRSLLVPVAAPGGGRIMSSLARRGGLASYGGIAGAGGGLAA